MEPRLFSRGKGLENRIYAAHHPASMEPRLFSRGKDEKTRRAAYVLDGASMEPRLFSRGKTEKDTSKVLRPTGLQWSHGFSAVESGVPST